MYPEKQRYENLQHGYFECEGKYDIPKLTGSKRTEVTELVGFNYARSTKNKVGKGVHFFLDDYQFQRLWNTPKRYLNLLGQFDFSLSPDFSLYTDFPIAMQIYNHYRKHWLGAFWEQNGIEVIPTIGWSNESSFSWLRLDGAMKALFHGALTANLSAEPLRYLPLGRRIIRRLSLILLGGMRRCAKGCALKLYCFTAAFRKNAEVISLK